MGKIHFVGLPPVPWEGILSNKEDCKKRGLPRISQCDKRDGRLAVVGGGPSVLSYLDEIKACSEVWGINGACRMLREHGIESTLFAMDPDPIVQKWCAGAPKAILCDRVCPEAFDALKGADVRTFELINDVPGGVIAGSSSASAAFHLGVLCGFSGIDFFGIDSSFEGDTHVYQDEKRKELLWVKCNGDVYKTAPDFYLQAQEMSFIFRKLPKSFRYFGGGLMQAMIADEEHDVTHVSNALMSQLRVNGQDSASPGG